MMLPFRHALVVLAVVTASTACSSRPPDAAATVSFAEPAGTATPGMVPTGGMPAMSAPMSASASAPAAPPVGPDAVLIQNFAFVPATLTVKVGATVTWTNQDGEPHTVVADGGQFHSPAMDSNAIYSYTFAAAGTYGYVCSIHPFMRGSVVVTP